MLILLGRAEAQHWEDVGNDDIRNSNKGDVVVNSRLGLGTSSPDEAIEVSRGGNLLFRPKNASSSIGSILFKNPDLAQIGRIWTDAAAGDERLFLSSAAAEASLTIDGLGNIGVGTVNPVAGLHVQDHDILAVSGNGNAQYVYIGKDVGDVDYRFSIGYNSTEYGPALQAYAEGTSSPTYLPITLQPDGGTVGIGTSAPDHTLSIAGSFDVSGDQLVVDYSGMVGIGTDQPETRLHIRGNSGLTIEGIDETFTRIAMKNTLGGWDILGGNFYAIRDANTANNVLYIEDGAPNHTMYVASDGKIGIGKNAPQHLLDVAGTMRAEEIILQTSGADFVFADDYPLLPIGELASRIREDGHLPDVPSAGEMAVKGVGVSTMQILLLRKIEELTLYTISQQAEIDELKSRL